MVLGKRKYSNPSARFSRRVRGNANMRRAINRAGNVLTASTLARSVRRMQRNVSRLNRTIESKQFTWRTSPNVALAHNNVTVVQQQSGGALNPFRSAVGADEPMGIGGSRVGDQITVRGLMIKGFMENALNRPKVFYRIMLIKASKGDTIDRDTLFKNDTGNKMIDQVNNERFTIIAQKLFNINAPNGAATGVSGTGEGSLDTRHATGAKVFKMWIPGNKLARGGNIQYENGSQTQVKHFDYRICIVVYDWYGTPQDVNNVGRINELFTKVYFKDA